jgi:hypothetical protein
MARRVWTGDRGRMRRRSGGALALAVVAALTCTGCVRTDAAYHQARAQALEDARRVADEVERPQPPATGADPGTPGHDPPGTNVGMLERIADEFSGPEAQSGDRVLKRELVSGQPWTGFLGAVEVLIGREAERGSSLFQVRQAAVVCVRFELHGDNGPRRVTIREIDCPPWSPPPPSRT